MSNFLVLFLLLFVSLAHSHEGHHTSIQSVQQSDAWQKRAGSLHFVFLHFPIALINMLVIAELLFLTKSKPIFDQSARFMLTAAVLLAIPTALFGLIYSYTGTYSGFINTLLSWHMYLGIAVVLFSSLALLLRKKRLKKGYYFCLLILCVTVNIAGLLGGKITFGSNILF